MSSSFSRLLVFAAIAAPALCYAEAPITATFSSDVRGVQHSQPTASIRITLSRPSNAPRQELPLTWNFGDNTFNAAKTAVFPSGAKTALVSATLTKIGSGGPVTLSVQLPGGGSATSGVLFSIPKPIKR